MKRGIAGHYAVLVHATYEDALAAAGGLRAAVRRFAESPDEALLEEARRAWIAARLPYLQSEAFRFYDGPIDGPGGPEGLINAWPMDEAYVDAVAGAPGAGIINDPEGWPVIDKSMIVELNEKDGETNIAAGFHAIEFLLWGQDVFADSAGRRAATDFSEAPNADRRKAFLLACTDLLVENLEFLVAAWAPERDGNYRAHFVDDEPDESLGKIVKGIEVLSGFELSGERLLVAWESQAQEDEHSCFSDTTHLDIRFDMLGVRNVYRGEYRRLDGTVLAGPSLRGLAAAADPGLDVKLDEAVARATAACHAIPAPFDQAVLGTDDAPGRARILEAIDALEDLAALFMDLASIVGFELPETGDVAG